MVTAHRSPSVDVAACDDLYTAVYALIDDAKSTHRPLKLYKGSPSPEAPHPVAIDAGTAVLRDRVGLFGFAATYTDGGPGDVTGADLWAAFDRRHHPRISVSAAFSQLAAGLRRSDEDDRGLTGYLLGRRHALGHYRGGSSGFDDEARAFLAAHFAGQSIPAGLDDVLVFCGGAKGAFISTCAALMCRRVYDELHHHGGVMLAPRGYYQSLRLIPAIFGGDITVVDHLDGASVRDWLKHTATTPGRVIYVPLVNNATGEVLDRARAHGIARTASPADAQ